MKELYVVAGIIEKDNKILCMLRDVGKFEYTSLKWEFPGGKIEEGETHEEALTREIMEEMDMDIVIGEHYLDIKHEYPDFILNMYCYKCDAKSYDFKLNVHKDYKWLERAELPSLEWAAADKPIIDKLMSEK